MIVKSKSNNIRICFFSPFSYGLFYPESRKSFGGAEIQLFQIGRELSKDPLFKISFILADFGQPEEHWGSIELFKSFRSRPKNVLNYFFAFLLAPFLIWRALKRANADVYIQRGASAETGIIALFCKLDQKKFVYMAAHERDCNSEYIKKYLIRGRLFRYGLHNADLVLVQHQDQKTMLSTFENIKSQTFPNVFPMPIKPLAKQKRRYMLWIGRLIEWKQPEIVLELAREFPQEQFVIIGDGKLSYAQRLKSELQAAKNITYLAHVPFAEIFAYFENALLFINTSRYEGFPNTFIQALQYGVPVVSLHVDPGGFLEREKCGYCAKGNLASLREQIGLLLRENELYLEISEQGRRYFEQTHEISGQIPKLKQILLSLC